MKTAKPLPAIAEQDTKDLKRSLRNYHILIGLLTVAFVASITMDILHYDSSFMNTIIVAIMLFTMADSEKYYKLVRQELRKRSG